MASTAFLKITACPTVLSLSPSRQPTRASSWIESSSRLPLRRSTVKHSRRTTHYAGIGLSVRGSTAASVTAQTTQAPSHNQESKEIEILHRIHDAGDLLAEKLGDSNIYLIGMMGCGKTTVGKTISDALGYYFFDSDTVVEQTAGTTVAEIFSQRGEGAFRELETQAISNLSSMSRLVVATGGGAIIRPENWKNMRNGIVVWIDVPLNDLATRVVNAGVHSRPLVDGGDVEDKYTAALTRLNSIYEKRKHLYPQADVRLSLSDIAQKHGLESVSQVTPDAICMELLKQVADLVDEKHMNNEYCALDSSWIPDDMLRHHLMVDSQNHLSQSQSSVFVGV